MLHTLSASFHLTHDCNLRCSYCFTGTSKAHQKQQHEWRRKQMKRQNPQLDSLQIEQQIDSLGSFHYGTAKEDVLKKLEELVKQYILWAKQQQGY